MCYVENLTGDLLSANKQEITDSVDNIIEDVGGFLGRITAQMEAVSGGISALSGGIPSIDGIVGDIGSALDFDNIKFSVFGCDLDPKPSISDFYTFASGSAGVKIQKHQINLRLVKRHLGIKLHYNQKKSSFAPHHQEMNLMWILPLDLLPKNSISDVPADQNPDPASNTVEDDVGIDQSTTRLTESSTSSR